MSSLSYSVVNTQSAVVEALKVLAEKHNRSLFADVSIFEVRNSQEERQKIHKVEICETLIDLLAAYFNVSSRELRSCERCRREVARVRQIGMYVAHTLLGLTMAEVASGFARDKSTVMYACHLIEDMREEAEFDTILASFEYLVGIVTPSHRRFA